MSQMLKSSGAMAAATLTSRVLGMVREMVYAAFMGSGAVASAFVLAFQVPNLFRRLLGEGALTAAFIPIFKQKEVKEGETEMWRSANAVISGLTTAAGAVTVLAVLGISLALAAGQFEDETRLMLRLLRLMFPYMLLVCLAAVFIGMANARGHFFVPALGAVRAQRGDDCQRAAAGPAHGAHAWKNRSSASPSGSWWPGWPRPSFSCRACRAKATATSGFRPGVTPPCARSSARCCPAQLASPPSRSTCSSRSVSPSGSANPSSPTFNYSVRLMELPQGMFGISLATYLLPTLAGLAAAKKLPEFRQTLSQGLSYLAFANLIASAIALALAVPIVRLLFERGKFGPDDTQRVALSLACLAPGLLMFSMNNILGRAFYALNDIKTPMKISLVCLGLNLVFAVWLVQPYRAAGLGVANTLSATLNLALLVYALRRKLSRLGLTGVVNTLLVLVPDAVLAGVVAAAARLALGEAPRPRHPAAQARDGLRARRHRRAGLLAGGALAEGPRRPGDDRPGPAKVSEGDEGLAIQSDRLYCRSS